MSTHKTSDFLLSYAADLTSIREHFTTHDPSFASLPFSSQTTALHALLAAAHADLLLASSTPATTSKILLAFLQLQTRLKGYTSALLTTLRPDYPETITSKR